MRRGVFVLVLTAPSAHAQPAVEDRVEEKSVLSRDPDGPWLSIDPMLRPTMDGLGAVEDRTRSVLYDGKRGYAVVDGTSWTNTLDGDSRGWQAALRVGYDLGPVRLDAHYSINYVDTWQGRGHYRDWGVSLGKSFKLSKGRIAWVALSVGERKWVVDDDNPNPPPGEDNGVQLMLGIGFTF